MRRDQSIADTREILLEVTYEDVAAAITSDTGPFETAAEILGRPCRTKDDLHKRITQITRKIDDGLADWIAHQAEAPGAWFCRQAVDLP